MVGVQGGSIGKWDRRVVVNDGDPGFIVDQNSTGNIVEFRDGGTTVFKIADGGTATFTGHILFGADNTYDIGSASYSVRNLYVDTLIYVTSISMMGNLDMNGYYIDDVGAIYGNSAPVYIGDAAATSHSLVSEDDLVITGKLEVDDVSFFDGTITLGGAILGGSQNVTNLGTINGLAITANTGVITTGTWNATVIGAAYGGTGVANNAASTITISGAYELTLTLSNTTGVNLPTSGTLATLAGTETFTNKTLTSPAINGTVTTTGLTMPAFSMGNNTITNITTLTLEYINQVGDASIAIGLTSDALAGKTIALYSRNSANTGDLTRLVIGTIADITTATWLNITQVGLTLGGSLDANNNALDNISYVAGYGHFTYYSDASPASEDGTGHIWYTANAAKDAWLPRLSITGATNVSSVLFQNSLVTFDRQVYATSPNSGTTGAYVLKSDTGNNPSYIQWVNNAVDAQWGYISINSSSQMVINATGGISGIVLGGNMTVTGYAFDAGAGSAQINTTGSSAGLILQSTQDGTGGAEFKVSHISTSPANNDILYTNSVWGKDAAAADLLFGATRYQITSITQDHEYSNYYIELLNDGSINTVMAISGAGALWTDSYVNPNTVLFDRSVDSAAVADQVSIGGYEISAGHRALAISSEETVVSETVTSDRTLQVRINGETFKWLLKAV